MNMNYKIAAPENDNKYKELEECECPTSLSQLNKSKELEGVEAAAAETASWTLEACPSESTYGQSLIYLVSSRPTKAT